MKNFPCLIACFLAFSTSCSKNNSSPSMGSASAIVNGADWKANSVYCSFGATCYPDKLYLEIDRFNEQGFLRESYGFQKIIPVISIQKTYPFTTNACFNDTLEAIYATMRDDGDVLNCFYTVIDGEDNYLKIENYNSTTNEISGSFAGTYVKGNGGRGVDTIRIINGKFYSKISN